MYVVLVSLSLPVYYTHIAISVRVCCVKMSFFLQFICDLGEFMKSQILSETSQRVVQYSQK